MKYLYTSMEKRNFILLIESKFIFISIVSSINEQIYFLTDVKAWHMMNGTKILLHEN